MCVRCKDDRQVSVDGQRRMWLLPAAWTVPAGRACTFADGSVEAEGKRACRAFANWLQQQYVPPLLLCIGLRNRERLRTPGGGYACGASLGSAGFADAAYIRTAAGSYAAPVASIGKDNAQAASLHGIAHEAAHPFQWVDGASLKGRGQEWQAGRCAHRLLRAYARTRRK